MVEVRRRQHEGVESLFRRFSRKVQQSGVLLQARKIRFYSRKKSRTKRREEAQRRTKLLQERERLIKLGEIDSFTDQHQHHRSRR
jgi:ribosomal protein S21